jgi:Putative esterase
MAVTAAALFAAAPLGALEIGVSLSAGIEKAPVDGRVLVMMAKKTETEPRFQVVAGVDAIPVFGLDVDGLKPGQEAVIDGKVFGYPFASLAQVPAGEYQIQAVLQKYETFRRSDGHTVKLPMDQGEGRQWSKAPGNLVSTPKTVRFDPAGKERIRLVLDQVIPPIEPPKDTRYVKHIRIQSKLLTAFWGRPMHLGAHVLLPAGFEEHPEAKYPLMILHGHFPEDFSGFREDPPDPDLKPDFNERFQIEGYNRLVQQEAHDFYKKWTGPDFPRFLVIEIQHANPYYDDSYAVNSENLGPYGDAIQQELIPEIEARFRGQGQPWSRFLYGGSTGGWEALAAQIFYPDFYNGAFGACPDPVDFSAYTQVDIYKDKNAYYAEGAFHRVERPGHRNYLGQIQVTLRDYNHLELVLGTNSRSGDQFDIWQAVYSPVGKDGYPQPIWDKRTGEIDPAVAASWKERYDLRAILERDWKTLGPKLRGKLHLYCGTMDNYYLNNAVYKMEEFLKRADPPADAVVEYGDRAEHCWNGDPDNPNGISRLRYNTLYLPKILKRIEASAPPGADLKSWRY